jgi:uncharacterized protein RhaS with RHS repeats
LLNHRAEAVAEYDGSGVLQAEYISGAGLDEWLVMERGGQEYYYSHDGLGSVTEVTDSTGAIAESYTYTPFGQPSVISSVIDNPYLYTGRRWDEESGLYHYRARQYDAKLREIFAKRSTWIY